MHVVRLSQRLWAEYAKQVRRQRRKDAATRAEVERQALILDHLDMVERIARTLGKQPFLWAVRLEDLIADGRLGLCEAAVRYRPHMGKFEHYAYFRIRGAIIDPQRRKSMWERDGHCSIELFRHNIGTSAQIQDYQEYSGLVDTDPQPRPDARFASRQRHHQLQVALHKMNQPEKAVLEAHLAGRTLVSIAHEHGRNVTWSRDHLALAKKQVTNLVQGRAA